MCKSISGIPLLLLVAGRYLLQILSIHSGHLDCIVLSQKAFYMRNQETGLKNTFSQSLLQPLSQLYTETIQNTNGGAGVVAQHSVRHWV